MCNTAQPRQKMILFSVCLNSRCCEKKFINHSSKPKESCLWKISHDSLSHLTVKTRILSENALLLSLIVYHHSAFVQTGYEAGPSWTKRGAKNCELNLPPLPPYNTPCSLELLICWPKHGWGLTVNKFTVNKWNHNLKRSGLHSLLNVKLAENIQLFSKVRLY